MATCDDGHCLTLVQRAVALQAIFPVAVGHAVAHLGLRPLLHLHHAHLQGPGAAPHLLPLRGALAVAAAAKAVVGVKAEDDEVR